MERRQPEKKILKLFGNDDKVLPLFEISKLLGVKSGSPEYSNLKSILDTLVTDRILEKFPRRRYKISKASRSDIITGELKIINDTAFVLPDSDRKKRIFVRKKNLNTAFHGDKVEVRLLPRQRRNRIFGEIYSIVSRSIHKITGIIEFDGTFYFLIPDDRKYYTDFEIPEKKLGSAKVGDRVRARMISFDDAMRNPKAEVFEVLNRRKAQKIEFDSIIEEFMLPASFPKTVLKEAEAAKAKLNPANMASRLDLRKKTIITIDPPDAKDFDDALSLEFLNNGNYYLGVHIADLSHYVIEGTEIDKEALRRCNTVYLVDRAVHMLPEVLSTMQCSLKPGRLRLCLSVFIEYSKTGDMLRYEIKESLIKNKKRFDYDEVLKIIESGMGEFSELILSLNSLAQKLRQKRFESGGIDFDSPEIKFTLDESSYPSDVSLKSGTKSTQLVEECMLAANKVIALHIRKLSEGKGLKSTLPFIYRVHDLPNPEKFRESLAIISSLGVPAKVKINSSKNINQYLKRFEGKPEKTAVHTLLVRSMAKAEYSTENIGHFGLGFEEYTHFTSPIRRYPDLLVHRLLKKYMSGDYTKKELKHLETRLSAIAEQCTAGERLSLEAERASVKLAQCAMARKNIGREFMGIISGIVNYGIFVILNEIYVEGFIHIRSINGEYLSFDKERCRFTGRNNEGFHFGKRIKVKISGTDAEKRRVDLEFVGNI